MEEIFLDAQLRQNLGRAKVKELRSKGLVPAVAYAEGKESHAIELSRRQLLQLVRQHRLENAVITLKIKDDKKAKGRPCLIKEVQYDPVSGEIIHVDFNEISLTKVIKVNVPVAAKGDPVGVKQEGGTLEHILWEVEVECLPGDIPQQIEIDVCALKMGEAVHIKDIALPPGVKVLNDPEALVLSVVQPIKEEAPQEAVEGAEAQEPEVIKEKKEVAEEGAQEETKEGKEPKDAAKESKEKK